MMPRKKDRNLKLSYRYDKFIGDLFVKFFAEETFQGTSVHEVYRSANPRTLPKEPIEREALEAHKR